jgi:hypothetical protein
MFQRSISLPSSGSKNKARLETNMKQVGYACCLYHIGFLLAFLAQKMKAKYNSEMSVGFQQTAWHYFQEGRNLLLSCSLNVNITSNTISKQDKK